jgi:hypothetical protein
MSNTTDLSVPSTIAELKNIDITNFKAQEVGLSMLILQLAQKESLRIQKMSGIIDKLEGILFDPEVLEFLSPTEQVQRYELAMRASQSRTQYIQSTIKSINWNDIETRLLILGSETANDTQTPIDTAELQVLALKLLRQYGQENKE